MTRRQDIEHMLCEFRESHLPCFDGVSRRVDAVLQRVHEGLFDPALNVNAVKARARISDNNISCRFRFEMGVSIKRYIEQRRLEAASALLQKGTFSVAEVAQAVGYEHLQTFYAAFNRHFSCSPGVFRRDELARTDDRAS